jgi:oligopeptide/dipeptide ABC transporter ATP-binding protein
LPPGCRFAPRCPDVMEICHEKQPDEIEISPGHSVSCWKVR